MWQGLQTIMDYKGKDVAEKEVLLPDKLNTFFARFDDNSVPLTQATHEDRRLWFFMANVSKAFNKHVNPRRAAGPDGIPSHVLRACADQLAIPVCCPHLLQEVYH
jgi:hypothetical protein